jgi:hypothetical protein
VTSQCQPLVLGSRVDTSPGTRDLNAHEGTRALPPGVLVRLIKELHSPEPPDAHNTTNAHNTANTPNTTNTHNTATPVPDRNTPGLYKKHAMPQQRSSQLPQCRGIGRQDRNNNKQQMVAECVGLLQKSWTKKSSI